jgi:mitogen-activated protein kinase kinase kinase 11
MCVRVAQGDLKAGNVLLQHSIHGSYGQVAKISDFGLSAVLLNGTTHRSTASLGTITHMAPELLRNGRMSPSADVYSFGILSEHTPVPTADAPRTSFCSLAVAVM